MFINRLKLPGEVLEDDRANANYDVNTGIDVVINVIIFLSLYIGNIVVHLPKKNVKEHFDGLGLLTKLLSGKAANNTDTVKRSSDVTKHNYKPLVEVLGVCACVCVSMYACTCVCVHVQCTSLCCVTITNIFTVQIQMKARRKHVRVLIVKKKRNLTGP